MTSDVLVTHVRTLRQDRVADELFLLLNVELRVRIKHCDCYIIVFMYGKCLFKDSIAGEKEMALRYAWRKGQLAGFYVKANTIWRS